MSIIARGTPCPEFSVRTAEGGELTRDDIAGQTAVLVFFPAAFSSVCTDQLQFYQEILGDLEAQGASLYAISCDQIESQGAFREATGVTIPMFSDFEPKGAATKAFGAYFEATGVSNRALVIVGPDGIVQWSWEGEHPGIMPGVNLIFDGLAAAAR